MTLRISRTVARCAGILLGVACGVAGAWTSGPEGREIRGPNFSRNNIVLLPIESEPPNEHAELLQEAMSLAGLPESLAQDVFWVWPYVDSSITVSTTPARFSSVQAVSDTPRRYNIAGFASLADHAFSIGDWAYGLERCPDGTFPTQGPNDAYVCHKFEGHMGSINSNHFLPQAQRAYAYYHDLALERAASCSAYVFTSGSNSENVPGFREIIQECEREALLIEAFGQHFLQDAWAIGHMWHRWGGPSFASFGSDESVAKVVSGIAGLTHGAEAMSGFPDRLSSGGERIEFDLGASEEALALFPGADNRPGIGDLHADELTMPNYLDQRNQLLRCSASGIADVYMNTPQWSGQPAGSSVGVLSRADLVGEECFGQRATNRAMLEGWGLNVPPFEFHVPLSSVVWAVDWKHTSGIVTEYLRLDATARQQLVDELGRIELVLGANVGVYVQGFVLVDVGGSYTGSARALDEELQSLLGAGENAAFDGVAPYVDASQPSSWATRGETALEPSIARLFHRSHASEWCAADETRPNILRAQVTSLASDPTSDQFQAACSVCTEFVSRHVRLDGEPSICSRLGDGTRSFAVERAPTSILLDPLKDAASTWCGCSVAGAEISYRGEAEGVATITGLIGPVSQAQFAAEGSPDSTCGGEIGGPIWSRVAFDESEGTAQFFRAGVTSGVASIFGVFANRRPCSSFVAGRNIGTPEEEVWINVTERRFQTDGTNTSDREYQLRYYSGNSGSGGAPGRCEAGSVSVNFFGSYAPQFYPSCEHRLIYTTPVP